jgi:AAA ATPase domain
MAALSDTMLYLFGLLGIPEAPDPLTRMDASVKRKRTLDALRRIIVAESRDQPLVLIFEDLHWFDADSLEFLDLLVDAAADARILILTNSRPEHPAGPSVRSHYTEMRLQPLEAVAPRLCSKRCSATASSSNHSSSSLSVRPEGTLFSSKKWFNPCSSKACWRATAP